MQKNQLSNQTRSILYNFKSRIEEFGFRIEQFVSYKFSFGKKQLTQKQFILLIRETDDTLQSSQLNRMWNQINVFNIQSIHINQLSEHINSISIKQLSKRKQSAPNIQMLSKKDHYVQQIHQYISYEDIPENIRGYFNHLSVITKPLFNTFMQNIKTNKIFLDTNNPTSTKSQWYEHISNIIFEDYNIFQSQNTKLNLARSQPRKGFGQMMDINNINQGSAGDCYFLAAITGIVEKYPELIYRLFTLHKNPISIYGIRLFIDGAWQTIITDARFHVNQNNQIIYAKPHHDQIWGLLLQKAWAKAYKSYQNIHSGSSIQALTSISGAPTLFLKAQQNQFQQIQNYLNKGYIISCYDSENIQTLTQQQQKQIGIYKHHAYSIISIHPNLQYRDRKIVLIKIRNPWGLGTSGWKGDWSFYSKKWTQKLRNKLNYHNNNNDGSFYMNLQDFMTYFSRFAVCYISANNINSHISITSDKHHSEMISFNIKREGQYYFSLYQQSKRKFKGINENYQLSKSRIFLARINKGVIEPISSITSLQQNLHLQSTLIPGYYMISCKIQWLHRNSNTFNLTSYGPEPILFNKITKNKRFLYQFITSRAQFQIGKKQYYTHKDISNSYKIIHADTQLGYGYLLIRNNSKCMFQSCFSLRNTQGIKLIKPDTFPLNIFIPPNSHVAIPFIIDCQGYSYTVQQKINIIN